MATELKPPATPDRARLAAGRWRWLDWRSLTFRLILASALWIAVLLGAGGVLIARVFETYIVQSFDARLTQFIESMIGASELTGDGQVRFTRPLGDQRFFEPYSGWYWQVDTAGKPSFRSRSLWDRTLPLDMADPAFEERISRQQGPDDQILRVAERDVYLPDAQGVYRFAVAGDIGELDRQIARFRLALGWALGALGAGLIAALLSQVFFGLRPLRAIRRELTAIRSGRQQRLTEDGPPEIMPLIEELNALIDHNADVVERARTHTGNLAHALKTPLSVLINEAGTDPGPLGDMVRRQTDIMRRHVDHHLARARAAGGARTIGRRTPVLPVAQAMVRALERIHAERGIQFQITGDDGLAFRGARQDLDELLGNLMDNAAKWARTRVRLTLARTPPGQVPARLRLTVEDDGHGIAPADRAAVFARGRRADESVPGSGLGLAIVRDVSELCGGTVELSDSADLGGLKVLLDLPLADSE